MTDALDWREIGGRLRRARVAAALSQEQLGTEVGLDRTMIAKCEMGKRKLDALELTRLSGALGLPISYFLTSQPAVLSRRAEVADDAPTSAARDTFHLDAELANWLRDVRQLQDLGVLTSRSPTHFPEKVTDAGGARRAAAWVRAELRAELRPLDTLVEVAEQVGQLILVTDIPGEGASVVDDDVAVAIVSTQSDPARRRATAAHELGHMVLGDEYSSDLGVHSSRDERERLIDAFAAEFLVPGKVFADVAAHRSADDARPALVKLAAVYRVSWSLVLRQACVAGAISETVRSALMSCTPTKAEIMDAVGWLPQPDFESIRVPPSVARAVLTAVQRHAITPARAAELTRGQVSASDFETGGTGE
jgi:Zn-dependent peptidase ImmA (M78 family)/DNA-binding XRE family transcriptional regulator